LEINNENERRNNNELHIYDNIEENDNKQLNITFKYLEIDGNNISSRNKNNTNIDDKEYMIDNAFTYTIIGNINDKNTKDDDDNKDIAFSSNNLKNAITIITKIMENKEKDDNHKKINLLLKIIQNKINKEKNNNIELIKKYFNIFKQSNDIILNTTQNNLNEKEEPNLDREETKIDSIKNNNKKESPKQSFKSEEDISKNINQIENNIVCEKDDEDKKSSNRGKFGLVIKKAKIHKSVTNNILNTQLRNLKLENSSKNVSPNLVDNEIIPSILKKYNKANSFILDATKKSKIYKNINISKKKVHEILNNDIEQEKKEEKKEKGKEEKIKIMILKMNKKKKVIIKILKKMSFLKVV
jgi:hypothetical protein